PFRGAARRPRPDQRAARAVRDGPDGLLSFDRGCRAAQGSRRRCRSGGSLMTTLLALFRRPDGGPEAQATFEHRYTTEHLPLVTGTPALVENIHELPHAALALLY